MLNITKYIMAIGAFFIASSSYAASALDVSPICKTVGKDLDSFISRGSHCLMSEQREIALTDAQGLNVGTAKVTAYVYSDNPKNALTWTYKYKLRTQIIGKPGESVKVRPELYCYECTVKTVYGNPINLVNGLSAESITTFTPSKASLATSNPLFLSPSVSFQVAKVKESFDNAGYLDPGLYNPSVRCDIGKAKLNTQGCVYPNAPAIMTTIKLTDPDVDESAKHIKEAFLAGQPGEFIASAPNSLFRTTNSRPLHRLRDAGKRKEHRAISVKNCKVKYGPTVGSKCFFTGDSDEVATDCDCDEFPFAATVEGGADASVKKIDASDNRRAGARLGAFFSAERVLDQDEFFLKVD
ncbi:MULTISPECIES: NucA/NucB deoxyribonuclease domain-containing protein [Acinetobacter]|uniref:NucA/NucB deoxyribonuclease domain-containing protein n=1 Tax=Acinetobacter courvalinii TaxID=280147 RepID=A0AA42LES0_9GAMM|nr:MULTISPECIES: NucA/NucB deoxyribonuclease domain-containing protein [Acinetobacter]KYQ81094.1 deoxyribonuclease [Acinetobacter sp. NRRL B-65365]MDH0563797.1 NucA/NucB deoxyribonuclease domain-containing protein [Acinetobacter courvalinii]